VQECMIGESVSISQPVNQSISYTFVLAREKPKKGALPKPPAVIPNRQVVSYGVLNCSSTCWAAITHPLCMAGFLQATLDSGKDTGRMSAAWALSSPYCSVTSCHTTNRIHSLQMIGPVCVMICRLL
jgi:hypothetical protein